MKHRHLIPGSLAVILAGSALWGGYVLWSQPAGQETPGLISKAPLKAKTPKVNPEPPATSLHSAPGTDLSQGKRSAEVMTDVRTQDPAKHPASAAAFQPAMAFVPSAGPISEAELQLRAARVEQEANHDLKHLVGLLDLNESQQDRIFDALVRRAPDWHPAMLPIGIAAPAPGDAKPPGSGSPVESAQGQSAATTPSTPAPTLLDDIAGELTPEQQQQLANAELDRVEWWEAIIPQLLPDDQTPVLDTSTGSGTAAAAAPPPPDEIKEGGEEVILD